MMNSRTIFPDDLKKIESKNYSFNKIIESCCIHTTFVLCVTSSC